MIILPSLRPFGHRQRPMDTPAHAWWEFEDTIANDTLIRSLNTDFNAPLYCRQASSVWSSAAGGTNGNRASKASQTETAVIYALGHANGMLAMSNRRSFSLFWWIWPDSTDLNADSFTKPGIGMAAWQSTLQCGFSISAYKTNWSANFFAPIGGAGATPTQTPLTNMASVGTIGAKAFFLLSYDASTRKLSGSKNGASLTLSPTALAAGDFPAAWPDFCLGYYIVDGRGHPDVSSPSDRNMLGKWDAIGFINGKALTSSDASWLYNSGTGRTYADSVTQGIFT